MALAATKKLNWESHFTDRYAKNCLASGRCMSGCRNGRKQSLNVNFMPAVIRNGGTVVSCAPVKRILLEEGRAVGVAGRFRHPNTRKKGAEFVIRARKNVVVAASATHSPALLQRSGIRHPALGKFFRSHPGTGVFGVYPDQIDQDAAATQGWASMAFREDVGIKLESLALPPEMIASRLKGGGSLLIRRMMEYRHMAMYVFAVRAQAVGSVSNGIGDKPIVRYTFPRPDMERLRFAAHKIATMHFAAGATFVIPGIDGFPYRITPDQLDTLLEAPLEPRKWFVVLSHLFGGCVMGSDPNLSVCDPEGRVRGVPGLVVSDASVIPTTLGVNPQHTIMGLSRLRADQLLSEA